MKLYVDPDLCISCGLCVNTCPDVFDWGEDDKATVIVDEVPEENEEEALEALENCPTDSIKRKD